MRFKLDVVASLTRLPSSSIVGIDSVLSAVKVSDCTFKTMPWTNWSVSSTNVALKLHGSSLIESLLMSQRSWPSMTLLDQRSNWKEIQWFGFARKRVAMATWRQKVWVLASFLAPNAVTLYAFVVVKIGMDTSHHVRQLSSELTKALVKVLIASYSVRCVARRLLAQKVAIIWRVPFVTMSSATFAVAQPTVDQIIGCQALDAVQLWWAQASRRLNAVCYWKRSFGFFSWSWSPIPSLFY